MAASPGASAATPAALLLTLSLVAFAIYAPHLGNPYIYDDEAVISNNYYIRDARYLGKFLQREINPSGYFSSHFRPLTMASFHLNYRVGGLDPAGYRLVNLLLHLGCAALVFGVARRLLGGFALLRGRRPLSPSQAGWAAAVAAGLFALHPVHGITMLMVWKRTSCLAGLFFFAAVLLFLRLRGVGGPAVKTRAGQVWSVVGIVGCYLLALGAKETAITLPAVLLVLEVLWRLRRQMPECQNGPGAGMSLALHVPLWLICIAHLVLMFPEDIASSARGGTWPYLLAQARVIWLYIAMIPAPQLISVAYPEQLPGGLGELSVLAGGLGILALLGGAVMLARRAPLLSLAVLWMFVALSPTSSFAPNPLVVDEDRVYLAFLPIWALCGAGLVLLARGVRWRRAAAAALALLVFCGCGAFSSAQAVAWSEPLVVWMDAVKRYPDSRRAHKTLCNTLSGKPDRAVEAAAYCAETLRRYPGDYETTTGLVLALWQVGRYQEAERYLNQALRIKPDDPLLRIAAGQIYLRTAPKKGLRYLRGVLEQQPDNQAVRVLLVACLRRLGQVQPARDELKRIQPASLHDHDTLAMLADELRRLGQHGQAGQILDRLRREAPARREVQLARATLWLVSGELDRGLEAMAALEQVRGATPRDLFRVAEGYLAGHQPARAAALLVKVVRQSPGAWQPRLLLAAARLGAGDRAGACNLYRDLDLAGQARWLLAEHRAALSQACGTRGAAAGVSPPPAGGSAPQPGDPAPDPGTRN